MVEDLDLKEQDILYGNSTPRELSICRESLSSGFVATIYFQHKENDKFNEFRVTKFQAKQTINKLQELVDRTE